MKKLLIVLSTLLSIVVLMAFSGEGETTHNLGGTPTGGGHSGDPAGGNKTCSKSGCHAGATDIILSGIISSNIPGAGYTGGNTYTITANFVRAGHTRYGFEATAQNASGVKLGTLANLSSNTQLVFGTAGKYISHTNTGVTGSGSKTWNFLWTAPAAGLGPVTFYGAFNATNANGNSIGDSVFKSTLVVTEAPASVNDNYTNNFSLSTFPNPTQDNLNIQFTLTNSAPVQIDLFDIKGNNIGNLLSETENTGEVSKRFNVSSYPQGIYFLRLNVEGDYTFHKFIKL